MSTEYYLVCHKHKELVWCCSDGFSGPQLQCDRTLAAFVITHRNCELKVVDEHNEITDPFDEDDNYVADRDYKHCHDFNIDQILDYGKD